MARPEWRDPAKERFWRATVQAWHASGLSIRAFCQRRRVAEANFYAWRRELARRDQEQQQEERESASFVPVQVVGEVATALDLVVTDGLVVRVRPGFDAATLRQVLAVLAEEGAAC